MKTVKLGDFAKVERRTIGPAAIGPDVAYLGLEHIESGGRILEYPLAGDSNLQSAKFSFGESHVLYGKLRPYLAKIALPDRRGVCSTDILPILPGPELDRTFLAHYLRQGSMVEFANSRTTGANLPRLNPTQLEQFPVPLPPLDEQRRIAAILDQADAIRTKRRQLLVHLDYCMGALFRETVATSRPQLVRLGDVARFVGGASLPAGEVFVGQTSGTLLMKVSDMNSAGNERYVTKTVGWAQVSTSRSSTAAPGSVIIPKRGGAIGTNKKRMATRPTALDPNLMGVTAQEGVLHPAYLFEWFRGFNLSTIASGSSVPQLNKKDLMPLEIPLPPMAAQEDFARIVSAMDQVAERVTCALVKDDELFASLQSRAFRGEL